MKVNKIQVVLDDGTLIEFKKQAKKQSRSESNLARKYIVEGLNRDKQDKKPDQ